MISQIRKSLVKLMKDEISKENFLTDLGINVNDLNSIISDMLKTAFENQDRDMMEDAVYFLCVYEEFIDLNDHVDILNKIICADWHISHETIALLLEEAESPGSVEPLYKNVFAEYDYLAWDTNYALAVKCIYGLGKIATKSAIEKLECLSKENNEIIKENAIYQLKKLGVV